MGAGTEHDDDTTRAGTPEGDGTEASQGERAARTAVGVSRRRLLTTTLSAAALAAASTYAASDAVAHRPRKHSPTYRVCPRPELETARRDARVVWRGQPAERLVCLTFDDGPDPRWTPMVLDLLARHDARATFFVLGSHVVAHPDVARATAQRGHEIASHGWDHQDMTVLEQTPLLDEFRRTHDAIVEHTGTTPRLVRPPWGRIDSPGLWAASEHGYDIALWSHHLPTDGAAAKVDRDIETASPGMVVLCHDGRGTPAESLFVEVERLVATLTADGYRFVTVSEMLAAPEAP